MDQSQKNSVLEILRENFPILFLQEYKKQTRSQQDEKQSSKEVADELSQTLQTIIRYNVKQALTEEYGALCQQNIKISSQINELKERVLKMSIRMNSQQFSKKQSFSSSRNIIIPEQQPKPESNNQMIRLKKQVQSIKQALLKFSNTSILEYVESTNEDIYKKIDLRYEKLNSDIEKLLQRNSDAEMEKSINLSSKYQVIESRVESCLEKIAESFKRIDRIEKQVMEKYQTSFKSNNFAESHNKQVSKKFIEQKTQKKDKGFLSYLTKL